MGEMCVIQDNVNERQDDVCSKTVISLNKGTVESPTFKLLSRNETDRDRKFIGFEFDLVSISAEIRCKINEFKLQCFETFILDKH